MNHPLARDLDEIFAQTKELWEQLRGQSLFVTGGTGFVGTWMMEALAWADRKLQLDIRVVLLTRTPDKFRRKSPAVAGNSSFQLLPGNCVDFDFPRGEFAFVIHAATEVQQPASTAHPDASFDPDLRSTRHVLEFAREAGTKKFLFTSSGAVYGPQPGQLAAVPEDFAGAPSTMEAKSAYGQAKRASEFLCAMYSRQFGFDALIARLFAFAGPHLSLEGYAIGNFLRDAINGNCIRIESDGSTVRSYLYAGDLAVWLWTIFLRGETLRPYNVGSSQAITVRELAEKVAALNSSNTRVEVLGRPGVPAGRYVPETRRAQDELGLRARVSLEESLERTMQWHRLRTLQPKN